MRDAESQNEPCDKALLNAIAGSEVWVMVVERPEVTFSSIFATIL
jgi:hypothetical protein